MTLAAGRNGMNLNIPWRASAPGLPIASLVTVICLQVSLSSLALGAPRELVVFHLNDAHGFIAPRKAPDGSRNSGMALLATALREGKRAALRRRARWAFFYGGDMFQGTPVVDETQGECMVRLFNELKLTAACLGNHEFDYGPDVLFRRTAEARYGVVTSNVRTRSDRSTRWRDSMILPVGNMKLGLIGLTTTATAVTSMKKNVAGFNFLSPFDRARRLATDLRRRGADAVIVLSHLGIDTERNLARRVDGIDLIVGGHSHTVLREAERVRSTTLVQTGDYMRFLGEVRLSIDPERDSCELIGYRLIPLTASRFTPDPAIQDMVAGYTAKVDAAMAVVAGETRNGLDHGIQGDFSPVAALVADSMRAKYGADVAFFYPRGTRRGLAAGTITLGDIREVIPYSNTMVKVTMTGASLLKALEDGLSGDWEEFGTEDQEILERRLPGRRIVEGLKPLKSGTMILQGSGLNYSFDPRLPSGARVRQVDLDGAPLDPKRAYRVVVNNYLAGGGRGREQFSVATAIEELTDVDRFVVAGYLRSRSPLPPPERTVVNLANRIE